MISLKKSVRGRFLRITVPLIFLSVLGVFTTIEIMAHNNAMARLEQSSQAMLRTQAAALANPLWNIDDEQIRLSLEAIASNREIVLARVYGERGEVLSQAGEDTLRGDELVFQSTITFDAGTGQREIGALEFFVSQREIWQQTRARLLLAAGIALGAVAMEVGAALFALRRIVGLPLERLLGAINAERSGGRRPRVGQAPPDEMGQVMSAFDDMLAQQEVFEAELQAQARMEGELKIGRDMQLSMVPREFDNLTKGHPISLWAALEPAREVGGDFYDAFPVGNARLCLVIGDVSDKGVPAALLMAVTKTMIKSFAVEGATPREVVTSVNEELCRGDHRDMFVSLFVAILDQRTGTLCYCNAGHNPPLILDADGDVVAIPDRNGPIVGALPELSYTESSAHLADGTTLLLYTDGVTEASDVEGRVLGEAALKDLLSSMSGQPARDIVERIVHSVEIHEGNTDRTDDVTVLAVTFRGPTTIFWRGVSPATLEDISALGDDLATAIRNSTPELAGKVLLILDEIGSNVVRHADVSHERPIEISVEITGSARALQLTIADTGPEFDPKETNVPLTTTSVEDRAIGGLGLHLVRNLSETFDYQRKEGRNIYRMTLC